jgi:hypothetical protein
VDKRGSPAKSLYFVHAGMVLLETWNVEGWTAAVAVGEGRSAMPG